MRTEKEIIAAARQYLNDNKGKVLGFDGDCDATEDDAVQLIEMAEEGNEDMSGEQALETLPNWKWPDYQPSPFVKEFESGGRFELDEVRVFQLPLKLDSPIDCIKAFGDQPTPKQLARMMVQLGLIEEDVREIVAQRIAYYCKARQE